MPKNALFFVKKLAISKLLLHALLLCQLLLSVSNIRLLLLSTKLGIWT